jgi:Fur family ferric uptake transcriptional regulator
LSAEAAGPARATRQGAALERALGDTDDFRTAQELHGRLRADGVRIGLTTVYRHLQRLADTGEVDTVRTASGELAYRRCGGNSHHHHLVCRTCGRTVEVEGPEVESWLQQVARRAGYTDVVHTLEIAGLCRSCSASRSR